MEEDLDTLLDTYPQCELIKFQIKVTSKMIEARPYASNGPTSTDNDDDDDDETD